MSSNNTPPSTSATATPGAPRQNHHSHSHSPSQRKREPSDFIFGKQIGQGSYSTVIKAIEKETNQEFALKILDKRHILKHNKAKYVTLEKSILNKLCPLSPFIVKLYYTFQDSGSLYFALEYAKNGDLLNWIRKCKKFSVDIARFYAAELLLAIEFMHEKNVLHRDLKPENVLIANDFHIRITDFGTAKDLAAKHEAPAQPDNSGEPPKPQRNSFVGTAEYCPPELLNDRFASKESDLWSYGCIVYQMLAGRPPFKANTEYLIFQKIMKLDYYFPEDFDEDAQDFVNRLLVLDPDVRFGGKGRYDELKAHAFFKGVNWETLDTQTSPLVAIAKTFPVTESDSDDDDDSDEDIAVSAPASVPVSNATSITAISTTSVSTSSTQNEHQQQQHIPATPNSIAHNPHLEPFLHLLTLQETILRCSFITFLKRATSLLPAFLTPAKNRVLLLTNTPRLLVTKTPSPSSPTVLSNEVKEIPIKGIKTIVLKDRKSFELVYQLVDPSTKQMKRRRVLITDASEDATAWVECLQRLVTSS